MYVMIKALGLWGVGGGVGPAGAGGTLGAMDHRPWTIDQSP
jgi:hypothetical protein